MKTNKKVIQQKFNWKYFIFISILSALILSSILALALFFIYQSKVETNEKLIYSQELNKVKTLNKIILKDFGIIISDLKIIANCRAFNKFINNPNYDINKINNDLYNICIEKKLFDQIRYIDKTGKEVIRINYNNGVTKILAKNKLQTKVQRYYFKKTLELKKDKVFISPLDLNIERGKIERPEKPIIRFGTPVFDKRKKKKGILIINYLAEVMIDELQTATNNGVGEFSFLNSNGYWFKSQNPQNEWGFIYQKRAKLTFYNKFKSEWDNIINSDLGQFKTKNGLFTFGTFYPFKKINDDKKANKKYFFKFVSRVPSSFFIEKHKNIFMVIMKIYFAIVLFLILGSILFAYFLGNKKRTNEERKKLIRELQFALSEVKSLQGILPICASCKKIRDDKGYWNQIETYIQEHSDAQFSHGICLECADKLYPELNLNNK